MILWDIARASALVAFVCFTFTVVWGIGLSVRAWRPAAEHVGLHRFFSTLGLLAVGTHIAALMADRYAHVHPAALVGRDPRPGVVVGAVALWLAVALPLSFRLRRAGWIGQRAWRSFHYMGYVVWALSLLHGVTSGTDTRSPFAVALYAGSAALVAAAGWNRWFEQSRPTPAARPAPARASEPERSTP